MPGWYDLISVKPGVTGIQGFSQSVAKRLHKLYNVRGFCLGLCAHWLIDKRTNGYSSLNVFQEQEQDEMDEQSSLLSQSMRYTSQSQSEQIAYVSEGGGENIEPVLQTLASSKFSKKNAQSLLGVARSFQDDALTIGEHVSAVKARYFLLIVWGQNAAHAFGIVRKAGPGAFREFRVFDPNAGEFEVSGAVGILAILVWLKTLIYPLKLGERYDLIAFEA